MQSFKKVIRPCWLNALRFPFFYFFGFLFDGRTLHSVKTSRELILPSVACFNPDGLIWSQEIMEIFVHNPNNH